MWSALEDPNPPDIEPTQYRPTNVSRTAKQQHYRISGLITKFTKDSNLLTFQRDVADHLNNYGLDTITYLPNPQDASSMISILTDHAKFDHTKVASMEEPQASKYDKYDKGNIRDAKKFLMNSLDPELKKQMHESCKDTDSFIEYWMSLMRTAGTNPCPIRRLACLHKSTCTVERRGRRRSGSVIPTFTNHCSLPTGRSRPNEDLSLGVVLACLTVVPSDLELIRLDPSSSSVDAVWNFAHESSHVVGQHDGISPSPTGSSRALAFLNTRNLGSRYHEPSCRWRNLGAYGRR
jgi:hypothetical protein